jgi:hypothetical protein
MAESFRSPSRSLGQVFSVTALIHLERATVNLEDPIREMPKEIAVMAHDHQRAVELPQALQEDFTAEWCYTMAYHSSL